MLGAAPRHARLSPPPCRELASEQSLDVTSAREALREARSRGASLSECFAVFDALHELVNDLSAVRRITAGSLAAFAADNVCYVELRTTPRALRDGSSAEAYLEAVLEAMRGAEGATTPCGLPLLSRLVVSVDRARGSAAAEAAVRLALACRRRHGDWVAGLDLSGDPTKGSWEEVLPALDLARRGRLRVTVHAAEVENPEESAAMLRWRPDRMGHVCCMSQEQFDAMLRLGIPLELCLTSNVVTASVDSVQAHHFATLHPNGAGYWGRLRRGFFGIDNDVPCHASCNLSSCNRARHCALHRRPRGVSNQPEPGAGAGRTSLCLG